MLKTSLDNTNVFWTVVSGSGGTDVTDLIKLIAEEVSLDIFIDKAWYCILLKDCLLGVTIGRFSHTFSSSFFLKAFTQ